MTTALMTAVDADDLAAQAALIAADPSVLRAVDAEGRTAAARACDACDHRSLDFLVRHMVEHGCRAELVDLLARAIVRGEPECLAVIRYYTYV